jgi:hypothetical protein
MNREEFDALCAEILDYQRYLSEKDCHGRGGTTMGEMLESDDFAKAWVNLHRDPDYVRHTVRRKMEDWLGSPEEEEWGPLKSGMVYNMFGVPINLVGGAEWHSWGSLTLPPEELGAHAARALTRCNAVNRIERLRESAAIMDVLADALEERWTGESVIREVK